MLEPPDLWTTRMQAKFRDRAPHVDRRTSTGQKGDFIVCEPLRPFNPTSLGSAGVPPEEQEEFAKGGYAACRPGSWDPVERIKDMDFDGLGAEIFYCGYGMALFSHPDDEFQRDAHRAYNDWAAEYASYAPKRLFPIANISMTDPAEDLKELHRVTKLGFRGIFISNDPLPERRYDNPMWDGFWSAVEEYDMPVNIHILTAQGGPQVGANPHRRRRAAAGAGLPDDRRDDHRRRVREAPEPEDHLGGERHRLDAELPQALRVVLLPLRAALPAA